MSNIQTKFINGKEYVYLVYQEKGETKTKYLGKVEIFPEWMLNILKNRKSTPRQQLKNLDT